MIASRGATMAVDWEQRIDFARLRSYRLDRVRAMLGRSDIGALLLFDPNNLRYVTSTAIAMLVYTSASPSATLACHPLRRATTAPPMRSRRPR